MTLSGKDTSFYYEFNTIYFQSPYTAVTTEVQQKSDMISAEEIETEFSQFEGTKEAAEKYKQYLLSSRFMNSFLELKGLMAATSVKESLKILTSKIVSVEGFYNNEFGKVSLSDTIFQDFDNNLYFRMAYFPEISTMEGTLLSFYQRYAPKPFIELFSCTMPYLSEDLLREIERRENRQYFDVKKPADSEESEYSLVKAAARNHFTIRNTPMFLSQLKDLPEFYIPQSLITQMTKTNDMSEVYSAFQVVPQALYSQNAHAEASVYPVINFLSYSLMFGFKLLKVSSPYFDITRGASGESSSNVDFSSREAEYDVRKLVGRYIGEPFMYKGTIQTPLLRHIQPGAKLTFKLNGVKWIAYIKSVQHTLSVNDSQTLISFERAQTESSHALIKDLVIFEGEGEDLLDEVQNKHIKFNLSNLQKLLNND